MVSIYGVAMCENASRTPRELAGALVETLRDLDPAALEAGELAETLACLNRDMERLQAQRLRLLGVFDGRGDASVTDGLSSTAAWLRHNCRMEPRQASQEVHLARGLRELPEIRSAFEAGEVGYRHAAVLHQAGRKLGVEPVRELEASLVTAARQIRPDELRRLVAHLEHAVDQDGAVDDADEKRTRRWLCASTTIEGMVAIDGLLDPESGATVLEAITALSTPAPGGDVRSPAQRRADALTGLCRRALDSGELPAAGGQRPHLNVTVTWQTLRRQPGSPAAHLNWAGPVPGESARRLGCDAEVTRIVTNHTGGGTGDHDGTANAGDNRAGVGRPKAAFGDAVATDPALAQLLAGRPQVLDVGRRTRTIPPGLRTAIVARDGNCRFPGCDQPSQWCDCHHLQHWSDGGRTDRTNLVLLCWRHHWYVHEGGWRMVGSPGGGFDFVPPGHDPPGHNPPGHNPPDHDPPDHNPPDHNPPGQQQVA